MERTRGRGEERRGKEEKKSKGDWGDEERMRGMGGEEEMRSGREEKR